ncbi:hypothetical protein QJR26_18300 (plasmid) [Clostridium baratii]
MKKFFALIFGLMSLLFVGCGTKTVDISQYIEMSEYGYDTEGTVSASLNSDFYKNTDIFKNSSINYSDLDAYKIELSINPSKNLKNGDVVNLTLKYNEKLYKDELKVKLENSNSTYTVSKLEKAFLKKDDLSKEDYQKLKKETSAIAETYIDSEKTSSTTYKNFKFVDAFIKTSPNNSDSKFMPTLVYVYKVDSSTKYEYSSPTNTIHYLFVPVTSITLTKDGKLDTYVISPLDSYDSVKSYSAEKSPSIDSVKGEYLKQNERLEKIDID